MSEWVLYRSENNCTPADGKASSICASESVISVSIVHCRKKSVASLWDFCSMRNDKAKFGWPRPNCNQNETKISLLITWSVAHRKKRGWQSKRWWMNLLCEWKSLWKINYLSCRTQDRSCQSHCDERCLRGSKEGKKKKKNANYMLQKERRRQSWDTMIPIPIVMIPNTKARF